MGSALHPGCSVVPPPSPDTPTLLVLECWLSPGTEKGMLRACRVGIAPTFALLPPEIHRKDPSCWLQALSLVITTVRIMSCVREQKQPRTWSGSLGWHLA